MWFSLTMTALLLLTCIYHSNSIINPNTLPMTETDSWNIGTSRLVLAVQVAIVPGLFEMFSRKYKFIFSEHIIA